MCRLARRWGQLASGSDDQTVRLWDAQIAEVKGHTGKVRSVVWRGDGQQLALGSDDQTVCLWDAISHNQIAVLKGHTGGVMSVAWRGDGKQLASGSNDQTVRLWDAVSGHQIAVLKGHTECVTSVAWRGDGQQLASGSYDFGVFVWSRSSSFDLQEQERWTLTYRFATAVVLFAGEANLRGAKLSLNNRKLLEQRGAKKDKESQSFPLQNVFPLAGISPTLTKEEKESTAKETSQGKDRYAFHPSVNPEKEKPIKIEKRPPKKRIGHHKNRSEPFPHH